MKLVTDSREQQPLEFEKVVGVEYAVAGLSVGDYGAWHGQTQDPVVFERKGIGDLFNSFTAGYEQERAKILRAARLGLTYVLAIEASATEILKGHSYWAGGEVRESRKTGIAMLRQLCTIQRKYGIQVQFFSGRREMALYLQEYFLSWERVQPQEAP